MNPREQLLQELRATVKPREVFTDLFRRGCNILALDAKAAARVFDTSVPTASRWLDGTTVPPAAEMVLRFLREELEREPVESK